MILAVTGHRPDKLYGYNMKTRPWKFLKDKIKRCIEAKSPKLCISGMALGVDMLFAEAAIEIGIPLEAAIPCRNQEKIWRPEFQKHYHSILEKASIVTLVTDAPYKPELMQIRNEYMVNRCDVLLAIWNGTPGGTANCVAYAYERGKEIIRIVPQPVREKQYY